MVQSIYGQDQAEIEKIKEAVSKFNTMQSVDSFKIQAGGVISENRTWVTPKNGRLKFRTWNAISQVAEFNVFISLNTPNSTDSDTDIEFLGNGSVAIVTFSRNSLTEKFVPSIGTLLLEKQHSTWKIVHIQFTNATNGVNFQSVQQFGLIR